MQLGDEVSGGFCCFYLGFSDSHRIIWFDVHGREFHGCSKRVQRTSIRILRYLHWIVMGWHRMYKHAILGFKVFPHSLHSSKNRIPGWRGSYCRKRGKPVLCILVCHMVWCLWLFWHPRKSVHRFQGHSAFIEHSSLGNHVLNCFEKFWCSTDCNSCLKGIVHTRLQQPQR